MNATYQISPSLNLACPQAKTLNPNKTIPRPRPKFPMVPMLQGAISQKLANPRYTVNFW